MMIKIFITVRNRLAITKKCIESILRHSVLKNEIYIYDNQTTYLLKEHFDYFYDLYSKGVIAHLTFSSNTSNFNAFSKAVSCNLFGHHHEDDPNKEKYYFLLFLDNDIILAPKWDEYLNRAWNYVHKTGKEYIKVITQYPGGIKHTCETMDIDCDLKAEAGILGGSGFWSVRNNFFQDVGFLNIQQLIGCNKRHDQIYWNLLQKKVGNKPYILGLKEKIAYHCGCIAGSVCNTLEKYKNRKDIESLIAFENFEEEIEKMTFEEFYKKVEENGNLFCKW